MPVPRCALVVDDSARARQRVSALLTLAGWQVVEVAGAEDALGTAKRLAPGLVVTAAQLPDGDGASLLRRLRHRGSLARFLVLTPRPDAALQAAVGAVGGTCLSSPVDPRQLVEFLRGRTTGPAAQGTSAPLRVAAERLPRRSAGARPAPAADAAAPGPQSREEWVRRLPLVMAQITDNARARNAPAVAEAAGRLAEESGRQGQREVALVSRTIATDAGRGILSQPRLMQLVMLTSSVG